MGILVAANNELEMIEGDLHRSGIDCHLQTPSLSCDSTAREGKCKSFSIDVRTGMSQIRMCGAFSGKQDDKVVALLGG